ncbi:MAG: hypothetical protein VX777_07735 [Chlamydiota bacterium]|nr:hypothetical protein [Chlamydiota bacterium]
MISSAVEGSLFAFGYTPVAREIGKSTPNQPSKCDEVINKYRDGFNIIMPLSWIPIIGAIAGIVRVILGTCVISSSQTLSSKTYNLGIESDIKSLKCHGAWSIIRGLGEILTLGFIAPVNVLVDVAYSITKHFTMSHDQTYYE